MGLSIVRQGCFLEEVTLKDMSALVALTEFWNGMRTLRGAVVQESSPKGRGLRNQMLPLRYKRGNGDPR